MTSGYEKDFEALFVDKPSGKDDEWAHIEDELDTASIKPAPASKVAGRLPTLDMLARPDELFLTTTPYILMVELRGNSMIEVQCSHSKSLELLAAYLRKWGKSNPNRVHVCLTKIFSLATPHTYILGKRSEGHNAGFRLLFWSGRLFDHRFIHK